MEICNICQEKINTDIHHIQSTAYGGKDIDWNKCKICPNCHRKVHTGFLIIEGWFKTSKGKILIWRNKDTESVTSVQDPKVWLYNKG